MQRLDALWVHNFDLHATVSHLYPELDLAMLAQVEQAEADADMEEALHISRLLPNADDEDETFQRAVHNSVADIAPFWFSSSSDFLSP